jgi:hypothetical protein
MNNPEKLEAYGTEDEEHKKIHTAQYVLDKQTQIAQIMHEPSKTTGVKDETNIVFIRKS